MTFGRLVYRPLTGRSGKTLFAMGARGAGNRCGPTRRQMPAMPPLAASLSNTTAPRSPHKRLFLAPGEFRPDTRFALASGKVRHQFEKRDFKSERNPLKHRNISRLASTLDFRQEPL